MGNIKGRLYKREGRLREGVVVLWKEKGRFRPVGTNLVLVRRVGAHNLLSMKAE